MGRSVRRVRFSGEDYLNGHIGLIQYFLDPLHIPEDQVCSFISCKSPGKPMVSALGSRMVSAFFMLSAGSPLTASAL